MPKGNNYPAAPVAAADLAQARQVITELRDALDFVPQLPDELVSKTTIAPERLPLADKALEAAALAPDIMRRSFQAPRLTAKLAAYRQLHELLGQLDVQHRRLSKAVNVLGSDILFDVNNIHEDVEKDNGETADLGQVRTDLHAYYRRKPGTGGPRP